LAACTQNAMLPQPYVVQRVRRETPDTYTLECVPPTGSDGIPFAPGQFNMVYAFGIGEVPISISGDPAEPERLIHTVRAVGQVSKSICKLKYGDELWVRGPFGSHWPVETIAGKDVVIVAGGIGLAPLRSAIYSLMHHREQYGHIVLLYGARTPHDLIYRGELEQWRGRLDNSVEITVDSAEPEWRGNVGVVTTLIARATFEPSRAIALVCGPEIMIRFTVLELQKQGMAVEDIYVSLERNMKCAIGFCGHCQFGPAFICKDGPVLRYDRILPFIGRREV